MMLLDIHEPGETPMPHEKGATVGIDLGTTNSLVAIANQGMQEVVTDEAGNALLPSVVAYEDEEIFVGQAALDKPKPIHSIKRFMGRGGEEAASIAHMLPYPVSSGDNHGMVTLDVGGKPITPVQISAEILKTLKERAEKELENDVTEAVITVPAYFDDAARQATKDAAKLAGLEVLRLVNEPAAAALAYGLDNASEGIYAVYDLGGGTFDVSLLKMEKGIFQVIATGGDTALGGDDMDHAILALFLEQAALEDPHKPALLQLAREAKESLTDKESWQGNYTQNNQHITLSLTRDVFNKAVATLIERTINNFKHVLLDAELDHEDIEGVVMVGGATRVPAVQQAVKALTDKEPLTNLDPDKVVAIGAALQAEALTQGSNNLLLDVTPLSLGLETMGGLVEVIIGRNTPIPATASQQFTTYQDGQTGMQIHVLQGEREMVDQCRSLATFELKGIPPMKAGQAVIEVTFTLDADGILTVSAREETTGKEQKIEVKPSYGLPPEQVETMLRESMEYAQQDITRRLLTESRVDADLAIKSTKAALEQDRSLLSDQEYQSIEAQLAIVASAAKEEDRDAIDYEVQQLEKITAPFAQKRVNKALSSFVAGKNVEDVANNVES